MTAKWGPGCYEPRSEVLFPIYSVLAPSSTAAIYSNLFLKIIFPIYWGLAPSILLSIIVYHFFLIYSDFAAVTPYRSLRWTVDSQEHFKFASTAAFHLRLISDKHQRELTQIFHIYHYLKTKQGLRDWCLWYMAIVFIKKSLNRQWHNYNTCNLSKTIQMASKKA